MTASTSSHRNPWVPFDKGHSLGQPGSEAGTVVLDEEHIHGGRITLERDTRTAPFAITSGIYDWMVHTSYFSSETKAHLAYAQLKVGLSLILSLISSLNEGDENHECSKIAHAIQGFVEQFP